MVNFRVGDKVRVKVSWDREMVPVGTMLTVVGQGPVDHDGAITAQFDKPIRGYSVAPWFRKESVDRYLEVAEGPW